MAEITTAGIQPDGLTGFVSRLETAFRAALGNDLNLASETPQGQLIGDLGIVFAEVEELALHVAAGLNLDGIQGRHITDWGTLLGLPQIAGERSTVTATLTGITATIVPRGSRARTDAGAVFVTDRQVTIGQTGTVEVLMRAAEVGPVVAAAGALTQIVDARAGWSEIANATPAALGRAVETAAEYRRRYTGEVATHARDALEAVRARVLGVDGVTGALARDNQTDADVTLQGIVIEPGAALVVVKGGADADIAAAIALTKPAGGPTSGDVTVDWPHPEGFTVPIKFRRVDPIPIAVAVTLTASSAFPAAGLATMRQNLLQWFVGSWPVPGPGIFDQTGVGIAESIDLERLNTPLNAVPGHTLDSVVVSRVAGGALLGMPNLDEQYTLDTADITFTLS